MPARNLDRFVEIQYAVATQDAAGQVIVTSDASNWKRLRRVWAEVKSLNGLEYFADGRRISSDMRAFVIRYAPDVTAQHRILYESRPYEIVQLQELEQEGRHHYTQLIGSLKA